MTDNTMPIDLKSIQELLMMHEDLLYALSNLPDFGFASQKNLLDIQRAKTLVEDLQKMAEYFSKIGNNCQDTFDKLDELLNEAGVLQCVNDLITLRKNSRRLQKELKGPKTRDAA